MTLDVNGVVERRRLRRRLGFWRIAALVLAALVVVVLGYRLSGFAPGKNSPHVARVNLNGVIFGSDARQKMFEAIGKSGAKAVLLEIDSPGGGVTASEELYGDIRKIAETRPVVAVVGSVAASGGYIAALATDRIIARKTSLTGSIGVLAQYPDLSGLMSNIGVKVESVKSAPLKAAPDMFKPTTPQERAALESLIMDSFAWFKALVSERRNITGAKLDQVSDGRAFTGRQALDLGLIDQIGGEEEARAWLAAQKNVSADLPIRDWKAEEGSLSELGLARGMAAGLVEAVGLPAFAAQIRAGGVSNLDLHALDGLLAIWHPSLQQ
ncbi:protease [Terrihabitans soli]|uniref:Protease n=1 Tax=Terrihabitans soli TaxID=708113 RepID=A0A6S6QZM9_9HYPH|nr:signal peptide peptidase SppA [Terrihabitans soli]BCJ92128.1 protease [Terrihabitans soli]